MSGLIESSSSLCPLLLPDIGSESKGQVLCVKTRGLNNFLRMVDGEENEQMQMLGIWESKQRNQSAVKKKKKNVCVRWENSGATVQLPIRAGSFLCGFLI